MHPVERVDEQTECRRPGNPWLFKRNFRFDESYWWCCMNVQECKKARFESIEVPTCVQIYVSLLYIFYFNKLFYFIFFVFFQATLCMGWFALQTTIEFWYRARRYFCTIALSNFLFCFFVARIRLHLVHEEVIMNHNAKYKHALRETFFIEIRWRIQR